jgi:hypothetical protein
MLVQLSVILEVERINPQLKRRSDYNREQRVIEALSRSLLPHNTRILLIHQCPSHPNEEPCIVPFFCYNNSTSRHDYKPAHTPPFGVLRHFGYMLIAETDAADPTHLFGEYPLTLKCKGRDNGAKAVVTVCGSRKLTELPKLHELGKLPDSKKHPAKVLFA